jgi:hypothetical protein
MMSGVKPWHIGLLVVSLVALGLSLYFSLSGDGVEMADSMVLVDLETGELVVAPLPKGKAVSPPALNPQTKRRTLFPAIEKDGKWYVRERYLPYVKEFVPNPENVLVDSKTGEVKTTNSSPRRRDVF